MRHVTLVTSSRADYGIYRPILRRLRQEPEVTFDLMVSGSHLVPHYGYTVRQIEQDGYAIRHRIESLTANDSAWGIAQSMALTILGFSQSFAQDRPELLLLLGDRYEMFAAATAAMPFNIPMAHIHGGEVTEGAMDEALRHSLTKMSHLHFASTEEYRQRIIQLGESPERVITTGAPSLDNLQEIEWLDDITLSKQLGLDLKTAPLLVTYHPVTLEHEKTKDHFDALLHALSFEDCPIIFTYPNADTNGQIIISAIDSFVKRNPRATVAKSLGTQAYFSLMKIARMMIGNSSSGIIEAASFRLPVVNIGIRQRGRVRGGNVLDCEPTVTSIRSNIVKADSKAFREQLTGLQNPYGQGDASAMIVNYLKNIPLDGQLILKKFQDLPRATATVGI